MCFPSTILLVMFHKRLASSLLTSFGENVSILVPLWQLAKRNSKFYFIKTIIYDSNNTLNILRNDWGSHCLLHNEYSFAHLLLHFWQIKIKVVQKCISKSPFAFELYPYLQNPDTLKTTVTPLSLIKISNFGQNLILQIKRNYYRVSQRAPQ